MYKFIIYVQVYTLYNSVFASNEAIRSFMRLAVLTSCSELRHVRISTAIPNAVENGNGCF